MNRILVVSDTHLDPEDPIRYQAILDAIRSCKADHLVLAGDIFEAWIGSDGAEELDIMFLRSLVEEFPRVTFIPGNRDFLVSPEFTSNLGLEYQSKIIDPNFSIIHGDELCTDDIEYQNFRRMVRSSEWQREFLEKPLSIRQNIARDLRGTSRINQKNLSEKILDVAQPSVRKFFSLHKVPLLVHGHTHRPNMHLNQPHMRVVTSDWDTTGRVTLIEQNEHFLRVSLMHLGRWAPSLKKRFVYAFGTPEWNLNS